MVDAIVGKKSEYYIYIYKHTIKQKAFFVTQILLNKLGEFTKATLSMTD